MTCSSRGIALIKQFEGCRLQSYRDPVGIWTIGYGTTHGVHPEQTITEEEADSLLRQEVTRIEPIITSAVKVPIAQGQFDALISFAYNLGVANLTRSTLLMKLNKGDMDGAAAEFWRWDKAGGKVLTGLIRRRAAEAELFGEVA